MRFLVLFARSVLVGICLMWPLAMMSLGIGRIERNGIDTGFIICSVYFLVVGIGFARVFHAWMKEYADTYYPKRAP